MRFHFPRRRLWLLTLLIWVGVGIFLLRHCATETETVTAEAVRLAAVMEDRYLRAAALLADKKNPQHFREWISLVGSQYAGYLKELEVLEKRLFWKKLRQSEEFRPAQDRLETARKRYEQALRGLQRPK
jgi:hypothetical protein